VESRFPVLKGNFWRPSGDAEPLVIRPEDNCGWIQSW
jgi:hypothetical protein